MGKSLLLAGLVVLAVLGAGIAVAQGAATSHGLLFLALGAAFLAIDRGLWSRDPR